MSKAGLVIGGALPLIPADLKKVKAPENSYIELTEFLPERIQDSVLYPDRKKRKVSQISVFHAGLGASFLYFQPWTTIVQSPAGCGATDIYRDGSTACLRSPRLGLGSI